ncbi:uncharacterized protein LOC128389594 [Panonychus citri]|uniref:uncharacterized protein LOC128389594 n=1 Tax=Panonychus citri TaxID=50023 RepID=UPI0023072E94|nr:uncharacterized protein LOC128389594 [Panonychus citri]
MKSLIYSVCIVLVIGIVHCASTGSTKDNQSKDVVAQTLQLTSQLIEFTDTSIVINITGPAVYEKTKLSAINFNISYQGKKNGKNAWIPMTEQSNWTIENVDHSNKEIFVKKLTVIQLKAKVRYQLEISGQYDKKILSSEPKSLVVRMKAYKPKGSLKNQVILQLKGTNPKTYFVQVYRIDGDKNVIIIDETLDASVGSSTTLDNLQAGKKYQIKFWYICTQNVISPPEYIDYQA